MTYRQFGARLEGHPTPVLPWVDVATGSLGQGLPIGVGMALAGKKLDRLPFRVWVICGDSEMAEGSMWEAVEHAAFYELDNLTAIIDVNRLGQRGETMHGWDLDSYARPAAGVRLERDRDRRPRRRGDRRRVPRGRVDDRAADRDRREDDQGQGRTRRSRTSRAGTARRSTTPRRRSRSSAASATSTSTSPKPEAGASRTASSRPAPTGRAYEVGLEGRDAQGVRRGARGARQRRDGDVVALDGEVSNSTFAEIFRDAHPERYFEMYIAEQQMVAAAVGMQVLGWKPFASTFAAFLSPRVRLRPDGGGLAARPELCGSHAGVSIGEDGPSQMALEDLAEFRAIHGSTVLYPCDGNQTAKLVRAMGDLDGISYLRTTRARHAGDLRPGRGVPGRRLADAARGRRRDDRRRAGSRCTRRSRRPRRSRARASRRA